MVDGRLVSILIVEVLECLSFDDSQMRCGLPWVIDKG